MISKKKALEMIDVIDQMFPDAQCELVHENPFELTIAVLLSAQCTDNTVNRVTKNLFQKYHTARRLFSCGFRRVTTRYSFNWALP